MYQEEKRTRVEQIRAEDRASSRDFSIVVLAIVLVAAIFGFIYFTETTSVTPAQSIEPAAGTTIYNTAPVVNPANDTPPGIDETGSDPESIPDRIEKPLP